MAEAATFTFAGWNNTALYPGEHWFGNILPQV